MSKLSSLRRPSRRSLGFFLNPAFFCAGFIAVLIVAATVPLLSVTAQTAAVADIKADNSDGPVTMTAPATFTVSWTSSDTANCQVSGTMGSTMGQPIASGNGTQQVSGLLAADYTFTISCDGASDSVIIHVIQATQQQTQPTTQYTGMCVVRRPDVALPTMLPFADSGRDYAKINKGTVSTMAALLSQCTDSDFMTLLGMYCGRYQNPVTFEAVLYDANNTYANASGASAGFAQSCSVVTPAAPTGLSVSAAVGKNVLSWTDNSSNETNFKIYKTITGLWTEIGTVGANVTTYTDSSVTPGVSNDYKVQAYNQQGNNYPIYSGVSNVVTVVAAASTAGTGSGVTSNNPVTVDIKINNQDGPLTLTAPTNYTATWTSSNATSCVTSGTWGNTNKGTSGSWQFNSVSVVAQNTYGMTCTGANGTATDSVVVNVVAPSTSTTSGTGSSSLTPPYAPSGMAATVVGGSVKLTWVSNSTNESGFKLYKIKSGLWTELTNVGAGVTTYTDTSVTAGQTYNYRVQSFIQSANSIAYSPVSNTATVTVTASTSTAPPAASTTTTSSSVVTAPTTTSPSITAPAAPSNLAVVMASTSYVSLRWTDNSTNETGFKLYKLISGGWTDIGNVSANTTEYTDTNVSAGVYYYYKVQAFAQPAPGAYPLYSAVSNIVSVVPGKTNISPLVGVNQVAPNSSVSTTTAETAAPSTTAVTLAIVTGTITDESGQPVAKVGIHAYNADFSVNTQAVTGFTGTYSITLAPGSYSVEVLLPSDRNDLVKPAPASITVTAGQMLDQSFQLKALAAASKAVSGTVRTGDGKAVADAVVKAVSQTTGQWLTAPVAGDGTYYLKLSPGVWNISILPATTTAATWVWQNQPQVITLADNSIAETATLNFSVTVLTAKVTVAATDEQGKPMAGAGIGISPVAGASAALPSQFKKTDSVGAVSFMVVPGNYALHFYAPAGEGFVNPIDQNFTVVIGEDKSVTVVFKKPQAATTVTVSGNTKMSNGTAIAEAAVWAWSEQGGTASASTDADGLFALTLAVGQRWHIGAGKVVAGYAYKSAETVVDTSSQPAMISVILLQVSSKPLPEAVSATSSTTEPVIVQSSSGAGVVVPAGAAPAAQSVQVDVKPTVEVPTQQTARVIGTVYDISMKDQSEKPVTALANDVEITLPYTREDLLKLGVSEDRLAPSYFDESVGAWVKIDNYTVDKQNHRIILHVRHFTRFALVAPADVTPPLTPLNVKGYRTGKTQVTLTWTDPKVDFHHTKVYRSESAKDIGSPIASMETGSFFQDAAVKANKRYYYRLVAVDAAGNESGFTAALSVRVSGAIKKLPQPPKNTAFTKYLSKGRKDTEVKYLQQTLQTLGFLPVSSEVTGTFDDATVLAVKQYQQSQGLKQSGVLDTLTRKALNKV